MDLISVLQAQPGFFYATAAVFALLVGSFLNVVIHRLPQMLKREARADCREFLQEHYPDTLATAESNASETTYNLVVPRSACPHCGHMITALENIPVISYVFLRGRCRECKAPISLRYPLVELLSAVLVVLVAMKFGVSFLSLFAALFVWGLIALTFIDLDTQYLPDQITLPFLWLGLLVNLQNGFVPIEHAVIGAAAGYMVLWLVYQLFKLLTKKEGMGFGDFKLLAMLGAWCGWEMLPLIILLSSVIGALTGVVLIVFRQHEKGKPIPFGPYLAGAGWVAFMWGEALNNYYLNLFVVQA